MTIKVVSAEPETDVRQIAKLLIENRISAVPVVDSGGKLVGIVSEGGSHAASGGRNGAARLLVVVAFAASEE